MPSKIIGKKKVHKHELNWVSGLLYRIKHSTRGSAFKLSEAEKIEAVDVWLCSSHMSRLFGMCRKNEYEIIIQKAKPRGMHLFFRKGKNVYDLVNIDTNKGIFIDRSVAVWLSKLGMNKNDKWYVRVRKVK